MGWIGKSMLDFKEKSVKLYPVPKRVQELIPVHRISEDGIFELEKKPEDAEKLYDKAYWFEDANFSTMDDDGKTEFLKLWCKTLNSLNVSYKILVMNVNRDMEKVKDQLFLKNEDPEYEKLTRSMNRHMEQILMEGLKNNFNINPILLLPPLVVILAIALKIPAIPGITLGLLSAAVMAPIFQGNLKIFSDSLEYLHTGVTFGDILSVGRNGFFCKTEVDALNSLLTTGGLMNMASSILMTVIAMMFGGIMEGTGQLAVVIEAIIKRIHSAAGLVGVTELTCFLSNIVMPEQYISILVPGRMYAPAYRKEGLHPKTLSNALESAGTVTSCLVPWNTCGMFIATTLGVTTAQYLPWAVFNYMMPLVCFVMAFFGITVAKMTPEEQARANAGEIV